MARTPRISSDNFDLFDRIASTVVSHAVALVNDDVSASRITVDNLLAHS